MPGGPYGIAVAITAHQFAKVLGGTLNSHTDGLRHLGDGFCALGLRWRLSDQQGACCVCGPQLNRLGSR